tara:strand:- start:1473 stop:2048 length:576 start_codon:yes stop_codon:yes gene_type:complete
MQYFDNIPYEAFFAIYLIIACNFIGEVFGCKFRQLLQNNMLIKHLFAFLTLMFLVVFISFDIDNYNKLLLAIFYSVILYIWFVLTTKTHIIITIIIITIFFAMYIIDIRIKKLKSLNDINNTKLINDLVFINNILLIIAAIITIFGVVIYFFLKKKEMNYRKIKFSYYTFFLGNPTCRNDKYENIDKLIKK